MRARPIGEADLRLFAEGRHRRLWEVLGAHPAVEAGRPGVAFAVWAPRAEAVSVLGDFCAWDGAQLPMRRVGASGIWERFVPGAGAGASYQFEVRARDGGLRRKTDPFAAAVETAPRRAGRVFESRHAWGDAAWCARRAAGDPLREPLSIYEVHLGSWRRRADGGWLGYRELAGPLAEHALGLGFTHVELLPVMEHPFDGSWGYQVTGYYAPTGRHGSPDDLRAFVDHCHRAGLGVILDWVPAHFPRDDFALFRFDGEPLYEYADPRLGEHPHWGTLVFDYGRGEVRSFLLSSALYWLEEFHADGLRVDAVASMLYRDYGREGAEWVPNQEGGRENLEAVQLLRALNAAVGEEHAGCFTVAEESTTWPGVTRPVEAGGLGFTFKWNLGWMHDTLAYLAQDPALRPQHHDRLTFAAAYEESEHFLMPLSHDEVVHGKRSLLEKMPGDLEPRLANLRLLLAYQFTRPGKKLLFMGTELAPAAEWDHDAPLDWSLERDPRRHGLAQLLRELGALYRAHPCLWRADPEPDGFAWIDCGDREASVVSYLRRSGDDLLAVVLNASSLPRTGYRIGAPRAGRWRELLSTDAHRFGGSGFATRRELCAGSPPWHALGDSLLVDLPPLACLVLAPAAPG